MSNAPVVADAIEFDKDGFPIEYDADGYEIELTREEREARLDAWWGRDEDVPQSLSRDIYRWWW